MLRSLVCSRLLTPSETRMRQSKCKSKSEIKAGRGAAVPSLGSGRRRGVQRGEGKGACGGVTRTTTYRWTRTNTSRAPYRTTNEVHAGVREDGCGVLVCDW